MQPQPISHGHQPPAHSVDESQIPIERIPEIKHESLSISSSGHIPPQPQSIKDILFKSVMDEEWDAVISSYKDHKDDIQMTMITRTKETALHVAVSSGKQKVVEKLLDIIDCDKIGMMTNERDENPLHQAAALGQVEICKLIVDKDVELIGTRNENGETPLFLAALHGKKGAFYALHPTCPLDKSLYLKHDVMHCKKNDGNTILHAAIIGEHFGFIVDPINVEKPSNYVDKHQSDTPVPVPENYRSCSDLLTFLVNVIVHHVRGWETAKQLLLMCNIRGKPQKQDVEAHDPKKGGKQSTNCRRSHIGVKDTPGEASDDHMSTSRPPYPTNYYTFFRILRIILELFLFIFGIGFFEIRKIKEKKRKHTLTLQVMMELIRHSKFWEYVDDGAKPSTSAVGLDDKEFIESHSNASNVTSNQDTPTKQSGQPSQDNRESMIKKFISEMKGKKIQVGAEKIERDVYTLQMLSMDSEEEGVKKSSPFLIAAKMGVKEMVEEILNVFPVSIWDEDEEKKNVVLLAVENRHPKIYDFLLKKCPLTKNESAYKKVDKDGNSALHLAATISKNHPWRIPGAALQMQWELKWYKFIKSSLPRHFFTHQNNEYKTPKEVFAETHKEMIKDGGKWLTNTSRSCSVVAVLIATVAFASATTVPGGPKEGTGIPNLRGEPAFEIFTLSSLVAFCLSVTSLTMFLSILTSRYHVSDFLHSLPRKLILGLTSLFISIAAMSVAFCAGHYYDLGDKLRHNALTIYAITCLPVAISTVAQFPLYFDLIKSTITSVPEQSYEFPSI